jgi:hypothetical protein
MHIQYSLHIKIKFVITQTQYRNAVVFNNKYTNCMYIRVKGKVTPLQAQRGVEV